MFALVPLLTVVMGSGALVAISPMVDGLEQAGTNIPLKTAVSILFASIIYLSLMLLVFKVAANLTRGWRLGKAAAAPQPAYAGGVPPLHQERALTPAAAPANAAVVSDRVRSTVASIETISSTQRLALHSAASVPAPSSVPQLGFAGPSDARGQLRFLHHRVAAVASNPSKEMVR
jgi:type IV secretion system protein VirB6